MKKILLIILLFATASVYGQEVSIDPYLELLRSDVKAQKVALITEAMKFSEKDGEKFWPIYREYELELSKLHDNRIKLIKDYAEHYEKMKELKAREIAQNSFNLEEKRLSLKRKYFKRLEKALSPIAATRFFQLERQINLLVDLQIATRLPLIKK